MNGVRIMKNVLLFFALILVGISCGKKTDDIAFSPGELWYDVNGEVINAHAGGILTYEGRYYWFGEYKTAGKGGNLTEYGVSCYVSDDLTDWENLGIVLKVDTAITSEITKGCIIERPKVIFNESTNKFVMWFHLELKGEGYNSARTGVAVSDNIAGPYTFEKSFRPNAGVWPLNFNEKQQSATYPLVFTWWTTDFIEMVENGLFVSRDFDNGQMSRDMTVYVDDDGKAYHIRSSEENLTIHIAELSDDYLSFTDKWIRIFPGGHNEAPAIFKRNGKYYLITSGCTGWDPNEARLSMADSIMGKWTYVGNPCFGENSDKTFLSQSTFVLPVDESNDIYIFMGDRWRPRNPIDGRYVWLPIAFEGDTPRINWYPKWDMNVFNEKLN